MRVHGAWTIASSLDAEQRSGGKVQAGQQPTIKRIKWVQGAGGLPVAEISAELLGHPSHHSTMSKRRRREAVAWVGEAPRQKIAAGLRLRCEVQAVLEPDRLRWKHVASIEGVDSVSQTTRWRLTSLLLV